MKPTAAYHAGAAAREARPPVVTGALRLDPAQVANLSFAVAILRKLTHEVRPQLDGGAPDKARDQYQMLTDARYNAEAVWLANRPQGERVHGDERRHD